MDMIDEYAYDHMSLVKWYVRHTKSRATNHRIKTIYQRFNVIDILSTGECQCLIFSCGHNAEYGVCCCHIIVVCNYKLQMYMMHYTYWRKY